MSCGTTGWCNGSTKDFGPFCLGSNPNSVIYIGSITVMHQTVNLSDVGSTPTLCVLALSSNGLGQRIFVPFIGVRIPVGSLAEWQSGLMQRFTKPPIL